MQIMRRARPTTTYNLMLYSFSLEWKHNKRIHIVLASDQIITILFLLLLNKQDRAPHICLFRSRAVGHSESNFYVIYGINERSIRDRDCLIVRHFDCSRSSSK